MGTRTRLAATVSSVGVMVILTCETQEAVTRSRESVLCAYTTRPVANVNVVTRGTMAMLSSAKIVNVRHYNLLRNRILKSHIVLCCTLFMISCYDIFMHKVIYLCKCVRYCKASTNKMFKE